jgi:hypothetical protein
MALGGSIMRAFAISLCVFSLTVHARAIEKVDFPETKDVAGAKLVLNGVALRTKRKIGIDFRVYVAGLYLVKKATASQEILASETPKVLSMQFLRSLSKSTLTEAWEEGYNKNCGKDCEATKGNLKAFNDLMADVKDGSKFVLTFTKDKVHIELDGKEKKAGDVASAAFSKDLLAVFIGEQPPTEDFKKGLLAGK